MRSKPEGERGGKGGEDRYSSVALMMLFRTRQCDVSYTQRFCSIYSLPHLEAAAAGR